MRFLALPLGAVALMFYIINVLIANAFPARSAEAPSFHQEVECLAITMYWEGERGNDADQAAIAQNVLNRTLHSAYGNSVCEVINQAKLVNGRTVYQYSFMGDNRPHPATQMPSHHWVFSQFLAEQILRDWYSNGRRNKQVFAEVRWQVAHSTHYHTPAVQPLWSTVDVENCRLKPLGQIGAHLHYAEYAKADPIGHRLCRLALQK